MSREDESGICYVIVYVDDCLVIGNDRAVTNTIEQIKSVFSIKEKGNLEDYLGCEICFDDNRTNVWIGQPHLLKKLEDKFGTESQGKRIIKTPGTPRHVNIKVDEQDRITNTLQERYRSGVGMLLYLVKHSRPDIANPVRELSRTLDGANQAQYKEMLRVIRFVLDTKDYGLRLSPNMVIENG